MTGIPKDSPAYRMAVDLANAKVELQRLLDDNLFAKKHERANQLAAQIADIEVSLKPIIELGITARQAEALGHLAHGLSLTEIGKKMHLSEDTIRTHLGRAKHQLGARNLKHAIAISVARGIVKVA